MASSATYANAVLLRESSRGGSAWFRLLDEVPPDELDDGVSIIADLPPVEIPLDGATSWDVANRQANPADPLTIDTSVLAADVVPKGWVLFEDEACTLPTVGGNLVDIIVLPDSDVTVPTQTITIRFPASAAKLL